MAGIAADSLPLAWLDDEGEFLPLIVTKACDGDSLCPVVPYARRAHVHPGLARAEVIRVVPACGRILTLQDPRGRLTDPRIRGSKREWQSRVRKGQFTTHVGSIEFRSLGTGLGTRRYVPFASRGVLLAVGDVHRFSPTVDDADAGAEVRR